MSTAKQTGPKRQLPHVLQLRLNDTQRRYVLYLAARSDVSMAEAVRQLLERSLDRAPRAHTEGDEDLPAEVRGSGIPLRVLLDAIDEAAIAELAERHHAA